MTISRRKSEHLRIAETEDVVFHQKNNGFEHYDFIHCALPELNLNDISISTQFLGKNLSFPFLISAMTGGFSGALRINAELAEVCASEEIAISLGSQRPLLEDESAAETYRIVRNKMPHGVVIGNIGAAQLVQMRSTVPFARLVDVVEADAFTVHLNPLQEVLQPEGDVAFKGVLQGIETLVKELPVPIVVKEVGCGISEQVAQKLARVGVRYIDVAGAGGTSWAAIEGYRNTANPLVNLFREWGIPTAESLAAIAKIPEIEIIASGGIDNGVTMAKALAMGAVMCGSALPVFKTLKKRKITGLKDQILTWKKELQVALFLTGCKDIKSLQESNVLVKQ